jgi:hypothetical protein
LDRRRGRIPSCLGDWESLKEFCGIR